VSKVSIKELVGFTGVVASLIFVGWEVNQNTVAARAAAYQVLGGTVADFWEETSRNPEQAVLLLRFFDEEDAVFTETEEAIIITRMVSNLRRFETIWRQVDIGLLEPAVLQHLGNSATNGPAFAANQARYWPRVAPMMNPDFRAYIEDARGYPRS